jgi:transposase
MAADAFSFHITILWLKPGVEVISRDRAGAYAQGARKGAPQAQQVTDRFHLLLNLQEALKRLFERKQEALQEAAQQHGFLKPSTSSDGPAEGLPLNPTPLTPTVIGKQARRARRLKRYEEVMQLHEQGASQVRIAALMGLHRDTVRRYLTASSCKIRVETQQESGLKYSITEVYSTVSQTLWRQRGCYVTWNGQPFTT